MVDSNIHLRIYSRLKLGVVFHATLANWSWLLSVWHRRKWSIRPKNTFSLTNQLAEVLPLVQRPATIEPPPPPINSYSVLLVSWVFPPVPGKTSCLPRMLHPTWNIFVVEAEYVGPSSTL